MRIEVFVTGWEQQCCGTPFGVGDEVTWTVRAEDPTFVDSDVPVFREEHHGQTPPHVPHREVSGTVESITGVSYVAVSEPGYTRSFIQTSTVESSRPVEGVGTADDIDAHDYRVELTIADDTELPAYVPWVDAETQRADDERRTARAGDAVGVMLRRLADFTESRYGHLAQITRATDRPAVTIVPHREGAAAIHWARSDLEERDGLHIEVGEGSWSYPASVTRVATLANFLDAAVYGRVEERVVSPDPETRTLQTVIRSEDTESWTAAVTVEIPSTAGSFFVVGSLRKRIQRGDYSYLPWEPTDQQDPPN